MEHFSAWVTWHGPYYTTKRWVEAADGADCHGSDDCFRLYMALGRANALSMADPGVQYVGLNARDSEQPLADEIKCKFASKRFNGLLNEYWLGELLTQFNDRDMPSAGVTYDTEQSIIYALNPKQNFKGFKNPPEFSFRVINEVSESSKQPWRLSTLFERLVPSFIEYDAAARTLSHGRMKFVRSRTFEVDKLALPAPAQKQEHILYPWERFGISVETWVSNHVGRFKSQPLQFFRSRFLNDAEVE